MSTALSALPGSNFSCLPAFFALGSNIFHNLTLAQGSVTFAFNDPIVNKYIFTRRTDDKAIALGIVKPVLQALQDANSK